MCWRIEKAIQSNCEAVMELSYLGHAPQTPMCRGALPSYYDPFASPPYEYLLQHIVIMGELD